MKTGFCQGFGFPGHNTPCPTQETWIFKDKRSAKRKRCSNCAKQWQNIRCRRDSRVARIEARKGVEVKKGEISSKRMRDIEQTFPGRAELMRIARGAGLVKIYANQESL